MNRRKSAIYNLVTSFVLSLITIGLGFVTQRFFIRTLGTEVSGLNNLLNTIVNIFVMADMGIGAAVIFFMYEPFAKRDYQAVAKLVAFYKKICYAVAIFIVLAGLVTMLFLSAIVNKQFVDFNLHLVFGLFIVSSLLSYLMTYKRAILQSDQRNYVINLIHTGYVVVLNVSQIIILITTKNYYLYLISLIGLRLAENIIINLYINQKYQTLIDFKANSQLDKDTKQGIIKRVKGSFFHNSAGHVSSSIDSIIVSNFFGLHILGLLSNYVMIFSAASILVSQVFYSITANLGNLLTEKNKARTYEVMKKIRFLNLFIAIVLSSVLFVVMNPFITLWLGKEYILETSLLLALIVSFYLQSMRSGILTLFNAAGMVYENRFVPVYESIINVVLSIALAQVLGAVGVFVATICSLLYLHLVAYPKYAYRMILQQPGYQYIKKVMAEIGVFVLILLANYGLVFNLLIANPLLELLIKGGLSLVLSLILFGLFYYRCPEMAYYQKELRSFKQIVLTKIKRRS